MSSQSIPVEAGREPFVTTTTPAIERANRLISLRANPGFLDLIRIFDDLAQKNAKTCSQYPGWDPQVMVVLKVRMQASDEIKDAVLSEINDAIDIGVAEARAQVEAAGIPVKSAEESIEQGDFVRQKVLETFTEMDTRIPGSYNTEPVTYQF